MIHFHLYRFASESLRFASVTVLQRTVFTAIRGPWTGWIYVLIITCNNLPAKNSAWIGIFNQPSFTADGLLVIWLEAEYCIYFLARFGRVHAFGYNSAESEPIWMKSGTCLLYTSPSPRD